MNGPSALMTKKVQVSSIMKQSTIWLLTKWHLRSIAWIVFIHRCLLYARLAKPNVNKNDTMNVNRNGQHSAGHRLYLAGLPRCWLWFYRTVSTGRKTYKTDSRSPSRLHRGSDNLTALFCTFPFSLSATSKLGRLWKWKQIEIGGKVIFMSPETILSPRNFLVMFISFKNYFFSCFLFLFLSVCFSVVSPALFFFLLIFKWRHHSSFVTSGLCNWFKLVIVHRPVPGLHGVNVSTLSRVLKLIDVLLWP